MIVEMIRQFRRKLHDAGVWGMFAKSGDPAFIEIIGLAGFDFVIIDLEHGPNTIQTAQNLVRAAVLGRTLPIVRTKEKDNATIGEALDIGAGGVEVPQVDSRWEAEEVIRRAKFAPLGMRGVCRFVRAADYSAVGRSTYFDQSNETVVIAQLEGVEALGNLEGILEVPGIDVVFIGPYDLSQSLGMPGRIDHPDIERKMAEIIQRCRRRSVAVGTFVDTVENARRWKAAGVQYLAYSVDVGVFYESCRRLLETLRG